MADVFVSYARSDKARVAPLVAAIEAAGSSVWWDPAIEPGQEFDRLIAAELAKAAAVLVVWTPTSVASRWVRGEAREAAERGNLVPVRFDGASLPIDFRALHTTDLDRWGEDAKSPRAQELLRALGTMIARHRTAQASQAHKSPARASIAVLPFANLTGDASKDFLGDGLAEELIHTLARVPRLRVPSRTSSFAYRGRDVDLRRIARELEVSTVLEGSVRAAGDRIRVTAQLIDGESGYHLWSQHYDRKFEDLFDLQDELASAIILQTLDVALEGPEPRRLLRAPPTRNLEAYLLYLEALTEQARGRVRSAFDKLQRALDLDPGFAQARAAVVQVRQIAMLAEVPLPGTLADAEHEARRALDGAPDSAATHAALGVIRAAQARWLEAEAGFRQAIALDEADPWAWSGLGLYLLSSVGHLRAALAKSLESYRLAPASPQMHLLLTAAYLRAGDDDGARAHAEAAIGLGMPRTRFPVPDVLWQVEVHAGRYEAARRMMQEACMETMGVSHELEAVDRVYGALEGTADRGVAIAALDAMSRDAGPAGLHHHMRRRLLVWYAMLGAYDQAYAVVNGALDEFAKNGTIGVAWGSLWLKELAGFREDVRFTAVVTRMRLPDYWQRHGPPDGYDWRDGRLVAH